MMAVSGRLNWKKPDRFLKNREPALKLGDRRRFFYGNRDGLFSFEPEKRAMNMIMADEGDNREFLC